MSNSKAFEKRRFAWVHGIMAADDVHKFSGLPPKADLRGHRSKQRRRILDEAHRLVENPPKPYTPPHRPHAWTSPRQPEPEPPPSRPRHHGS